VAGDGVFDRHFRMEGRGAIARLTLLSRGFVIFWYAFVLLFPSTFAGKQSYQDFVLNAYLWLMLGVLWVLPRLSASASRERHPMSRELRRGLCEKPERPTNHCRPHMG
jgi:hypothetical protein